MSRIEEAITSVEIRRATRTDAPGIAQLHADSWRRHYRGAYSDQHLDGDLDADRLALWTGRLGLPSADYFTLVAEHENDVIGFAHTALDADPTWGALLDDLHVRPRAQRCGIGLCLLAATARTVIERRPESGLYLWVSQQDNEAQAFYRATAGVFCDREPSAAPGRDLRNGEVALTKIRVAWTDPAILVHSSCVGHDQL